MIEEVHERSDEDEIIISRGDFLYLVELSIKAAFKDVKDCHQRIGYALREADDRFDEVIPPPPSKVTQAEIELYNLLHKKIHGAKSEG